MLQNTNLSPYQSYYIRPALQKKYANIFFRTKTYKIPFDLQTKHLNAKINIKISNFSSFLGIMVFVIWSRLDSGS